jgi:hypothetical protein
VSGMFERDSDAGEAVQVLHGGECVGVGGGW